MTCVWNTTSSKSVQTGNNMKMFQKQWNSVNQCTYLCLGHRGLGCDFLRRKIWTVQLILTDNFLTHCFITQLLIVCLSQHRNRNCTLYRRYFFYLWAYNCVRWAAPWSTQGTRNCFVHGVSSSMLSVCWSWIFEKSSEISEYEIKTTHSWHISGKDGKK